MYRVLLVDDDMIVRMFLRDVMPWAEHGFAVIGDARDGEEALALCAAHKPDLILTDISMPCMDGIELITQLRADGCGSVIVALSCHDDFELVKRAMQQGADDYLLKNHLDVNKIEDFFQKIRIQMDKRQAQSAQQQTMQSMAAHGIHSRQRELMEAILREKYTQEQLPEMLQQAGLKQSYHRVAVVLAHAGEAEQPQIQTLLDLCRKRLEQEPAEVVPLSAGSLAMLVDLSEIPSAAEMLYCLTRLQNDLQMTAEQYLNLTVNMGCSLVCEGEHAITRAVHQANAALQNRFYDNGRWQYGTYPELGAQCPPAAEQFCVQLPQLLESDASLQTAYRVALLAIEQARVAPGVVLQWLRRCDLAAGVTRTENQYSKLQHFFDYTDCVSAYEAQQNEMRYHRIPQDIAPAVQTAARYVQAHYREAIGLGHAARKTELTPSYLSALFKKEMGIGFSEYLLNTRLAAVRKELVSSNLTAKELSEQAGFADYQYFCKTFKKKVGLSPSAYRKKVREQNEEKS